MAFPKESQGVRSYDFRRPYQLSKLQVEAMTMVSEGFARAVSNFTSGYLRALAGVHFLGIEQVSYEEYAAGVPTPSVLHVFSHPPDAGNALAQFGSELAFVVIDRALGGPGIKLDQQRELTEIERAVFNRYAQKVLDLYAQAWNSVAQFGCKIEATEFNPAFTQIVGQGDLVVVTRFAITLDEVEDRFSLIWPYSAIRPYANALATHAWNREGESGPEVRSEAMAQQVQATQVEVQAVLGRARITLREFSQIEPGHVIVLDRRHDDALELNVDGMPKFAVVPGKSRGQLAVRVVGRKEILE